MKKMRVGALLGAPLVAAPTVIGAVGGAGVAAGAEHRVLDYGLTAEALVMIPAMNQDWLDLSKELYLVPNGFAPDGTATFLQVPETNDLNASLAGATSILTVAIEERWDAGDFSAADPLYVFGYSQASVAAGQAQLLLAAYGIPTDALHFVLVGDSAAEGGFLSGFMDTLLSWFPESWHDGVTAMATQIFTWLQIDDAMGLTTPSDLYPTDVYSLSSDGFANWDGGQNFLGMFVDHLADLGLSPQEIASAQLDPDLGSALTQYFMIDGANVDMFQALMNSFVMIMDGLVGLL